MQEEYSIALVDVLSEITGMQVVMMEDTYVYLSDSKIIPAKTVNEAIKKQAEKKIFQENTKKIAEAKKYLQDTDYKVLPDYDQDSTEVKVKRQEAREFIRANEGDN